MMIKNVWEKVKSNFYLDLRSLALFRVLFALAMIIDLIQRAKYLELHYTTWGAYPPSASDSSNRYCIHCISGSNQFISLLFILAGLINFSMMIGYKTRLSTVLSFIMLCSLQNRNHYVMDGSDDYTRVTLFWAIFLPLNKYYSIDSLKMKKKKVDSKSSGNGTMTVIINDGAELITQEIIKNETEINNKLILDIKEGKEVPKKKNIVNQFISVGTVGMILQFFFIYYFTASLKSGQTWHSEYTSVYYALSLLEFRFRMAPILLQYPKILSFLCRGTLLFEYVGPLMMVSPFFNSACRILSILGFIGMHFGFSICLNLYQFIYVPMIVSLIFLPSVFWERAREYLLYSPKKKENEIIIHYYRNNSKVLSSERTEYFLKIYKTFFLEPFMKVTELHHNNINSSIRSSFAVQYKNETVFENYQSLQLLLSNSFLLFPLGNKYLYNNPVTKFIVNRLFDNYLSKTNQDHDFDSKEKEYQEHTSKSTYKKYKSYMNTLIKIFCIYIIVYSYYYNRTIMVTESSGKVETPKFIGFINLLKLDQYWGMFAPDPPTVSRWTMIVGQFEKEGYQDIDMLIDETYSQKVNFNDRPDYLFNRGQRFRNYVTNSAYFETLKLNYGRNLCRNHNIYYTLNESRGKLIGLKFYVVTVPTPTPIIFYKNTTEYLTTKNLQATQEMVWDHMC